MNPTAALVDEDGIYVAYGKAVYRYDLDGSNERHLINTLSPVKAIHSDGHLLFINYTSGLYMRAVSINQTKETLIDTVDDCLDTIYGSSISPTLNRIFLASIPAVPTTAIIRRPTRRGFSLISRKSSTVLGLSMQRSRLIISTVWAHPSRDEVPFATLPGRPLGLEAAGEYLFAVDPSGAWVSHYTFGPDETQISAVDWNRSSSEIPKREGRWVD